MRGRDGDGIRLHWTMRRVPPAPPPDPRHTGGAIQPGGRRESLVSYIRGYDPETLREKVDPRQCKERLDEIGEQRSLPALLERVWLLKVLGRPEDALVLSEQSVRVARMAGTRKDLLRARILHASVVQVRGGSPSSARDAASTSRLARSMSTASGGTPSE